jgi:hypothetical protein
VRAENPVIPEYDFLDFWRTADIFAYQCRHSIKQYGLRANRFIHNYEIVREAARFYEYWFNDGSQDLGDCVCILPESLPLEFDEKASPKTNIDALKHKLDCWIQWNANIPEPHFWQINKALRKIEKIANKPPNLDQPVSYHISDDSMTYDQARGYCFEKNMWLADPSSPFLLDGIRDAIEDKDFPTVWFQPEWAAPDECWIEEEIDDIGFEERPVDCWQEHQAICKKGQNFLSFGGTQTCVDFKLAPLEAKSYDEAQEYCESIPTGTLSFFFSQDELDQFNNGSGGRKQLLGLVRSPEFPSGWGAIEDKEITEVDVFAWGPGQPTSEADNNCVKTRDEDALTWENVPCDFPDGIQFSCRIESEQFADNECIASALPDPPAA